MDQQFIFHNIEDLIKAFEQMKCSEKPFIQISTSSLEIPFSEVEPPEGYGTPVNKDTGEQFPLCCSYHKGIYDSTSAWFEKFPNCCEAHRNLMLAPWFKKDNYKDAPMKVIRQISYTDALIEQKIQ